MNTTGKLHSVFMLFLFICLSLAPALLAQNDQNHIIPAVAKKPKLISAVMCESVKEYCSHNPAVVFSIKIGKLSCLTSFDSVSDQMYIYHKWFYKDELSTKKRLLLKESKWSTMSTIQLREADKGPWRVEITDDNDNMIHVLRFSIVD